MAMIYVVVGMIAFFGFCSLAVDFGRVQTAKTELRRLADAAARAGAAALPQGTTAVQNAAVAMVSGNENRVDGASYTLSASSVQVGYWTAAAGFSTSAIGGLSAPNAVLIGNPNTNNKITYNVPLMFAAMLGMSRCQVTATSVAALVAQSNSETQYVSAHGNPWLAGQPAGTTGSVQDTGYGSPSPNKTHPWKYDVANPNAVATATNNAGANGAYVVPTDSSKVASTDYSSGEPWGSPTQFDVTPGAVVEVTYPNGSSFMDVNQGFLSSNGNGIDYTADGSNNGSYAIYSDDAANPSLPQGSQTTSGTEHGLSNVEAPLNSVLGVFMDQNGATYGADSSQESNESGAPSTPSGKDYSTQSSRDYSAVEPSLNQVFFVGTGQTSNGTQQMVLVPSNATKLFLGTMDGHEWSNNQGGGDVTVTVYQIQIVK
jgi:Flp pilus assembly protein TadG